MTSPNNENAHSITVVAKIQVCDICGNEKAMVDGKLNVGAGLGPICARIASPSTALGWGWARANCWSAS